MPTDDFDDAPQHWRDRSESPKKFHIPTPEEMEALMNKSLAQYYRIKASILIYEKFIARADERKQKMGEERYNKVLGWLGARVAHNRSNLAKTNDKLSEGARLRGLRDAGELN